MRISVIIPTYNRAQILKNNLRFLIDKKYVDEIIVVDDASTDKTSQIIEEIAKKSSIPIKYCKLKKRTRSPGARNKGISLATGEILIMLDDDMTLTHGANLHLLVEDFTRYKEVGIIGLSLIETKSLEFDPSFTMKCGDILSKVTGFVFLDAGAKKRFSEYLPHPIAIRREVIDSDVLYDEKYAGTAYREESDIQLQAKERGWKCLFEPEISVEHFRQQEGGYGSFQKKSRAFWKAQNHTYFLLKHFNGPRLFCYLLSAIIILGLYAPQHFKAVLKGFREGLRLYLEQIPNGIRNRRS